jgi:hypothetical protein
VKYTPPIRRVNTAKGHHYKDADGNRVPGVTTILGDGLPKHALVNWAANATADAAVNKWDDYALLPPAARLKALQGARYEERDAAAKRGTEVHGYGEQLANGEAVDVPIELHDYVAAYSLLLDEFKVEPVHVEFGCASYKHGYAGSGDLIAYFTLPKLGRKLLLVDLKTNKSGIFGETAAQLAAYRFADVLLGPDGESAMPEVDGCAAIHIRPGAADLIPVTADESVFRSFLYIKQVGEFDKVSRDLIGSPITPDSGARYRLVREDSA